MDGESERRSWYIPQTQQETLIGAAFGRSHFYRVTPSFIRFTNNGDSFAGRTEWQL